MATGADGAPSAARHRVGRRHAFIPLLAAAAVLAGIAAVPSVGSAIDGQAVIVPARPATAGGAAGTAGGVGFAAGPGATGSGSGTPAAPGSTATGLGAGTPAAPGSGTIGSGSGTPAGPGPADAPAAIALVPVVAPASSERGVTRAQLAAAVSGSSGQAVFVSSADLAPLAAALGATPGPGVRRLTPSAVLAAVSAEPRALGILRAEDVTPQVRALPVDGRALFGAERVRSLAAWPLLVAGAVPPGDPPFDPASAWTLVAGGDVMLDRAVYRETVAAGRGADYPWDGGTARIAGWTCCGAAGARLPVGNRTGNAGAVRDLFASADLSMVNLEGPAPDRFAYHPDGFVFTFDPALLAGLRDAGIDVATLANNHISNAGQTGVAQTIRHLQDVGLAHAGAGANLAAARRPAVLRVGGLRVAVLAYDDVAPALATPASAGAAPLRLDWAAADIRSARAAGADVVIVVVHWGIEYTDAVSAMQRRDAAALVSAGADAVIGGHSHWAGPVGFIGGRPVLYSLGDLVFELNHDARTLEGVIADMTFVGRRLVQLDLHPTLILDGSQPNLLDPARDGAPLLARIARLSSQFVSR